MPRRILSALLIVSMLACGNPAMGEGFDLFIGEDSDTSASDGITEINGDEDYDPEDSDSVASITDYPTLKLGDKDEDGSIAYVVTLQTRLKELGYLSTKADGEFGSRTEDALKSFQAKNNLPITGIADAVTQQLLYSDKSKLVLGTAVDTSATSSDAYLIQTKLAQWGFLTGTADGVLGDDSKKAISLFKGYVLTYHADQLATPEPTATPDAHETPDPNKLPEINDIMLPTAVPNSASEQNASSEVDRTIMTFVNAETPFQVYYKTVQSGDTGDEVSRVQKRLCNLKYLYSTDGAFGDLTASALKYFQRRNNLSETGVADQATQEALFSATAVSSDEYVFPYKLRVSISDQRVYVYEWDGSGYNKCIDKMKCSTGKKATPTPLGTYQTSGPSSQGEWYYFKKYNCYAKWATRIVGGILFHSVTYSKSKKLNSGTLRHLGSRASHGCVRLTVDDAYWIYHNCPAGTTVVIES